MTRGETIMWGLGAWMREGFGAAYKTKLTGPPSTALAR